MSWKKRFDKKFVQTYQGITNIDPDVKPDEIKQFIEEEIKKAEERVFKFVKFRTHKDFREDYKSSKE